MWEIPTAITQRPFEEGPSWCSAPKGGVIYQFEIKRKSYSRLYFSFYFLHYFEYFRYLSRCANPDAVSAPGFGRGRRPEWIDSPEPNEDPEAVSRASTSRRRFLKARRRHRRGFRRVRRRGAGIARTCDRRVTHAPRGRGGAARARFQVAAARMARREQTRLSRPGRTSTPSCSRTARNCRNSRCSTSEARAPATARGRALTLTGVAWVPGAAGREAARVEKRVSISLNPSYPGFALFQVSYRNLSAQPLALRGWRTAEVQLLAATADGTAVLVLLRQHACRPARLGAAG